MERNGRKDKVVEEIEEKELKEIFPTEIVSDIIEKRYPCTRIVHEIDF